ncbi:hypothetical protein CYLTODRAFT_440001 [Cylindrobasidium torrendii FP15055 ss-10]|uniref:Uncharacterized protein n=1 Tax=Cylindrobasidium torrendii FP15055 ss-10 TaxID=1314674 RepID=A0A0D7BSC7_9AGAR|nr:hypothetical protein CYLTODRAFT_440001 [Cylindrobasidium torrendii FP15055 ss-10]
MSVATPTVVPKPPYFPTLLPPVPRVAPQPLRKRSSYGHLKAYRDIQKELDEMSEEEMAFEETAMQPIHSYGFAHIVPIGRTLTQKEEKADAGDDDDGADDDDDDDEEGDDDEEDDDEDADEDDDEEEEEDDMDADMPDMDDNDASDDVDM